MRIIRVVIVGAIVATTSLGFAEHCDHDPIELGKHVVRSLFPDVNRPGMTWRFEADYQPEWAPDFSEIAIAVEEMCKPEAAERIGNYPLYPCSKVRREYKPLANLQLKMLRHPGGCFYLSYLLTRSRITDGLADKLSA